MPSPEDLDAVLMRRVRDGDEAAFEELVRKYQQPVLNMLYRFLGDRWEAEDIAQQVFVQVYRSARRYRPQAKFSTWLFTIVRHLALNELRRRRRHPAERLEATDADGEERERPLTDPRALPPDEAALQRELDARVRAAVQKLPEQQRMAVILLRYQHLRYEEICRVMRCSMPSLKSLLHRARLALRKDLQNYLQDRS